MGGKIIFSIIEFFVVTIIVYLFYFFYMINRYDDNGKLKKKKKKKKKLKGNKFLKKLFLVSPEDEVLLRGRKSVNKKKAEEEIDFPSEVELFIMLSNVDLSKINYKKLLKLVGLTCSIDIGLILAIVNLVPVKSVIIEILIGFLLVIPVIFISYSILTKILKKRGMIKNENGKHSKNGK